MQLELYTLILCDQSCLPVVIVHFTSVHYYDQFVVYSLVLCNSVNSKVHIIEFTLLSN